MEISMRWHRFLRAATFVLGLAVGLGGAVFIFSNVAPVDLHWRVPSNTGPVVDVTLPGVSLWLIAVVPLLVGGVLGYFYQTPARMHHVREAFAHRHRVHELEKELKELRGSLDKVLAMPEDGSLAVPAALLPPMEAKPEVKVAQVTLPDEPSAADLLADFPAEEPKAEKKVAGPSLTPARRGTSSLSPAKRGSTVRRTGRGAVQPPDQEKAEPTQPATNGGARRSRTPRKRVPAPAAAELN